MAIKKPLCNYGGDLKELQSGDTVEGASTSYASTAEVSGTHTTGSITSGTAALTVASGSGIADGDAVVGEGITPGTTVSSGGGTTSITLSANANATLASDPVSFYTTAKSLSPGNAAGMLCRAWVNFNGTGTVAIRASYNVDGITDNGTGNYTVNFTTNMADAVYGAIATASSTSAVAERVASVYAFAVDSCSISVNDNASALSDAEFVSLAIFR